MDFLLRRAMLGHSFAHSGLSDTQIKIDQIYSQFSAQASDWRNLCAMVAGGLAYRAGNLALLSVLPAEGRVLSPAFALFGEVTAFRGTHQLLAHDQKSKFSELFSRNDFIADYVAFATLKAFGKWGENKNPLLTHFTQDAGLVAAHQMTYALHLTHAPEGSLPEQFFHAAATNLALSAGTSLVSVATGNRFQHLERSLDLRLQVRKASSLPKLLQPSHELSFPLMGSNSSKGPRFLWLNPYKYHALQGRAWALERFISLGQKNHREALEILVQRAADEARLKIKNPIALDFLKELGVVQLSDVLFEYSDQSTLDAFVDLANFGYGKFYEALLVVAESKYKVVLALSDREKRLSRENKERSLLNLFVQKVRRDLPQLDIESWFKEPNQTHEWMEALKLLARYDNRQAKKFLFTPSDSEVQYQAELSVRAERGDWLALEELLARPVKNLKLFKKMDLSIYEQRARDFKSVALLVLLAKAREFGCVSAAEVLARMRQNRIQRDRKVGRLNLRID